MAIACRPSCLGGWGTRITWTPEAEVAVSQDCPTALQPGRQSKIPSQKKKKREREWKSVKVFQIWIRTSGTIWEHPECSVQCFHFFWALAGQRSSVTCPEPRVEGGNPTSASRLPSTDPWLLAFVFLFRKEKCVGGLWMKTLIFMKGSGGRMWPFPPNSRI